MFAEVVAVVAGVDDHGVLSDAELIEAVEQATEILIRAGNMPEVVEVGCVVGKSLRRRLAGRGGCVVNGRDTKVGCRLACFIRVEIPQSFRKIFPAPGAVRALESDNHGKWLIPVFLQPLDREVGADVIDPSGAGLRHPVDLVRTVHVAALSDKARRVVEAGTLSFLLSHVPFSDVSGLVSGAAEESGMGDGIGGKRPVVVGDAVAVVVLAGQKGGTARGAEGKGDERVAETDAARREAIHVRGLEPREARQLALLTLDNAHGVPALVIGIDEEEIRPALRGM